MKRMVPFAAPAGFFCQRKRRTSPFLTQCSVPFIGPYFIGFCARIRRLIEGRGGLDGARYRNPGYVSEAAHAPCACSAVAAGDSRKGPGHLADLDLAAVRRRSEIG